MQHQWKVAIQQRAVEDDVEKVSINKTDVSKIGQLLQWSIQTQLEQRTSVNPTQSVSAGVQGFHMSVSGYLTNL